MDSPRKMPSTNTSMMLFSGKVRLVSEDNPRKTPSDRIAIWLLLRNSEVKLCFNLLLDFDDSCVLFLIRKDFDDSCVVFLIHFEKIWK